MLNTYIGDVRITTENEKEWAVKLKGINHIGGYLSIHIKLDKKLEERLWKNNCNNKWYLTNTSSEFLLSRKGKIVYRIENVEFYKIDFDKVRKD